MDFQWMLRGINTRAHSFFPVWVRDRELRQQSPLGHPDSLYKSLYSSISQSHSWDGGEVRDEHGLLSLEFSPDGSLLLAGCEDTSFLMFDPLSRRLIRTVEHAHARSITNVKFFDSHIFATGSADWTVSLWDTRNLNSRLRTLWGYSSRIGNLEFSRKNNFLITTGLTHTFYIWDMKNWKLRWEFNTFMPHVLRSLRLNSDETKMIITTDKGYFLIVHDLDLNRIAQDLKEFEREMFDFASLLQANTTSGWSSSRFVISNRRRNRVEVVADFPNADGSVHTISALEMHPQGWSVISRSRSEASDMELICVHDIQEKKPCKHQVSSREGLGCESASFQQEFAAMSKRLPLEEVFKRGRSSEDEGGTESSSNDSGPELQDAALPLAREALERSPLSPTDSSRARSPIPGPSSAPDPPLEQADIGSMPRLWKALRASAQDNDPSFSPPNSSDAQINRRVHVHFPRMTHYREELYPTEWSESCLGVSADGRLVCSPFYRSIRLFAFSPECSEQSVSWYGIKPTPLYKIKHIFHSDNVLSARFSPRHCFLVSGDLDGKLFWYQPVL